MWADLDLKENLLTLRAETTKSKKTRVIPIRAAFAEELRAPKVFYERVVKRLPTANDPIFLSPQGKMWNAWSATHSSCFTYLKRAGIPRYTGRERARYPLHATHRGVEDGAAGSRSLLRNVCRALRSEVDRGDLHHLSPEDLRAAVAAVGGPAPGAVKAASD